MEDSNIIHIDKYDFKTVRDKNGSVKTEFYAVAGKTRYKMPEAFSDMYTEKYLAIKLVKALDSEVLGDELTSEYYIPIFTGEPSE